MFERFTESARRTLFFARYAASELGGEAIAPEHLLLGLLRADEGPTLRLFADATLSYTEARAEIRAHQGFREQVPTSVEIPFAQPAKRILQHATEEADRVGHKPIGTGHVLLAILREEGSFAAEILNRHGMTAAAVRQHLLDPAVASEMAPPGLPAGNVADSRSASPVALQLLEVIRLLADELGRATDDGEKGALLVQIHSQVDALRRHLAGS